MTGTTAEGEQRGPFRFLLINATDEATGQFLYPTDAPQGLLALKAGLRVAFPEVETQIRSWSEWPRGQEAEHFGRHLGDFAPHAVGISAYSSLMPLAIQIASQIKQALPEAPVILGGIHASAFPAGIDRYPMFDYYVRGEGVRVCARLLRHLFLGDSRLEEIPSLSFVRRGQVIVTPAERLPSNMDETPPIDWSELSATPHRRHDVIRLDERFSLRLIDGPMYPYESSQGCGQRCRFCERVNGTDFRAHSPVRIAADLAGIKQAIDAQMVFFTDEHVHHRRGHLEGLLDKLDELRSLRLRYYLAVRAAEIDRELVDRMVKVGVGLLHVFPEAGSSRIRGLMDKGLDIDRFLEHATYASDRGLFVMAGFIAGWPTETTAELELTYALARAPIFDFVFVPALRCLARSEMRPHLDAHGIEPDTPAYFEYLSHAWRLILADYGFDGYQSFLRRISAVNQEKVSSARTRAKLEALHCRIEATPSPGSLYAAG
jgi:anaerobic magnesium-protoporphyrin IX monomethyl ester cyclase